MKITIYTVNDCQFSKAEKEYLKAHNLPYEEKNLEANKEYLTEMLTLSNNFAGTPVTKVEKDDGEISILKGFTKEDFDKLIGVGQPPTAVVNSTMNVPQDQPTKPTDSPVQPPQPPVPPPPSQPQPPADKPTEQPPIAQNQPPKQDEALNSVLNNLQEKAGPPAATTQSPVTPPPQNNPLPNVPEPDFK
jgi:glutaredoxin